MAEGNNTALWVIGSGVAAYLVYDKIIKPTIVTPKKVQNYVKRIMIRIPTLRFKGDDFVFDMYIQNPNNGPLTVRAIVAGLYSTKADGKSQFLVGEVFRYGDVVIKPVSETKYTFSVTIKIPGVIAYLNSLFAGKVRTSFALRGTVNVDGATYPVNIPLSI